MKLFFDIVLLNALVCIIATVTFTFNPEITMTELQIWAACFVPSLLFIAYRFLIVGKGWARFTNYVKTGVYELR